MHQAIRIPVAGGSLHPCEGGTSRSISPVSGDLYVSAQETALPERPVPKREDEVDVETQEPATVILFNDEIHTFDEVIHQLIKAIGCDVAKAEALTWTVHSSGKAAVFDGPMTDCLRVVSVLEEIALHTQIEI